MRKHIRVKGDKANHVNVTHKIMLNDLDDYEDRFVSLSASEFEEQINDYNDEVSGATDNLYLSKYQIEKVDPDNLMDAEEYQLKINDIVVDVLEDNKKVTNHSFNRSLFATNEHIGRNEYDSELDSFQSELIYAMVCWLNIYITSRLTSRFPIDDLDHNWYAEKLNYDDKGFIINLDSLTYTMFDGWQQDNREITPSELDDKITRLVNAYTPREEGEEIIQEEIIQEEDPMLFRRVRNSKDNGDTFNDGGLTASLKRNSFKPKSIAPSLRDNSTKTSLKEYYNLQNNIAESVEHPVEFISVQDRIRNQTLNKNQKLRKTKVRDNRRLNA